MENSMIDFGYSILPSSVIDLDNFNPTLFEKLSQEELDVKKCMSCGACAATCTASNYTEMNLRKVIALLSRGLDKQALDIVKSCMLCGKCLMICPRGINTRHIILSICKIYKTK